MTSIQTPTPSRIALVDKPQGPSSHDAVRLLRRALHTRSIGHAGTLDPMATGLLVMGVGQGTKLLPYLMAQDKAYTAIVRLGVETDTLDAEGKAVTTLEVPSLDEKRLREITSGYLGEIDQYPPIYSALKQDGVALYKRARRGEDVTPAARQVEVFRLEASIVDAVTLKFSMVVGKGFYVRSFARDISRKLGSCGHLIQLRRERSGPFHVQDAVSWSSLESMTRGDSKAADEVNASLLTLTEACQCIPNVQLSSQDCVAAAQGKVLSVDALEDVSRGLIPEDQPLALIGPDKALVAIAMRYGDVVRVRRGFNLEAPSLPK